MKERRKKPRLQGKALKPIQIKCV